MPRLQQRASTQAAIGTATYARAGDKYHSRWPVLFLSRHALFSATSTPIHPPYAVNRPPQCHLLAE